MDLYRSTSNDKYQLKLKEKRGCIEDAIENVAKRRKDLEENCRNVKLEVQKSISLKVEDLRQREMQLLRQVDALIGHQSALLQMQLSQLYQTLGSFKAASQWAELGSKVCKFPTLNEEDLETVSPCLIHYQPDDKELGQAIQIFGTLKAQGTPSKVFLLPEEEGYGDGDHHVLHKTLQEENQTKIKVEFPKLSNKLEDWLPVPTAANVQNIEELELNSSSVSEVSESIEMLSHSDLNENQEWLQSTGNNNLGSSCICQDVGKTCIEIENLDSLSCIPNASNLPNISKKNLEEFYLPIPPISSVCKSNATEKCSSYDTCVCGKSCLVSNLTKKLIEMEIRDTLQQQDCINTAIKNNISMQWLSSLEEQSYADQKWLASISKSKSMNEDWLLKPSPIYKETGKKFEFPSSFDSSDVSVWLKQSTNSINIDDSMEKVDEVNEKNTESWLSTSDNKSCEPSYNIKNKYIKATFDVFFKQFDSESWLLKSCIDVKDRSG